MALKINSMSELSRLLMDEVAVEEPQAEAFIDIDTLRATIESDADALQDNEMLGSSVLEAELSSQYGNPFSLTSMLERHLGAPIATTEWRNEQPSGLTTVIGCLHVTAPRDSIALSRVVSALPEQAESWVPPTQPDWHSNYGFWRSAADRWQAHVDGSLGMQRCLTHATLIALRSTIPSVLLLTLKG